MQNKHDAQQRDSHSSSGDQQSNTGITGQKGGSSNQSYQESTPTESQDQSGRNEDRTQDNTGW